MSLEIEHFFGSKYKQIDDFNNEISIVTNQKGLKGAIDHNGKEIISCQYSEISPFNKYGLAAAKLANTGEWGIIDKKGNVVFPFGHRRISSYNYDVYFYVGDSILDAKDCHEITRGEDSKIDDHVYKFGDDIYNAKTDKFLDNSFVWFERHGNIYLGHAVINKGLELYDQNLNYIDTVRCVESKRVGDNLILKIRGNIRQWEEALINMKTGEYVPAKGNVGCYIRHEDDDGYEVYVHHIEGDKKSTIFVNGNNQLITLPDVHSQRVCPEKNNNDTTILRVYERDYEGIYTEDGKKIIPCEYWTIETAGNCYIVKTYDNKYGMIGFDGTIIMEPKHISIKYLGENIYYVTDQEGKSFLVDENGKIKADFSLPGVRIQGQEIITDSFEERNAWERNTLTSIKEQGLKQIAEIEAQKSEEINKIKTDCEEITEYLSGPRYTLPKK